MKKAAVLFSKEKTKESYNEIFTKEKIGILSMQKVPNYGSFFQAFALMKTVKELRPNSDVSFIDIKPGIFLFRNNSNLTAKIKKLLKGNIINFIQKLIIIGKSRLLIFNKYQQKHLNIKMNEHNWDVIFNTIIIGSDEVFNCLQNAPWGFSKNLLGEGLNSENIITYAASCGSTTVSEIESMSLTKDIETAFSNIKQFSVRDENTYQFVKRLANKEASIHVDPVFLMNFDEYITKKELQNRKYILVYSYTERISMKKEIASIRKFAKENNLEVISIFGYQSWCDKNLTPEPFEMLTYFKQASYIVTDTFHGTIFSIKFNKQFVSFIRYDTNNNNYNTNYNKLQHLLKTFELQDREISNPDDLSWKIKQNINYDYVKEIIDKQIKKSLNYLDCYL